jgi:hypothetical protein
MVKKSLFASNTSKYQTRQRLDNPKLTFRKENINRIKLSREQSTAESGQTSKESTQKIPDSAMTFSKLGPDGSNLILITSLVDLGEN